MVIHRVLDILFSTWSNIAVLRVLNEVKIGLSGREIAKQSGMSAPSCLEALSTLENLNIVSRQRGGRGHFFLNREHFLVNKIVIPNLNSEKLFIFSLLKNIKLGLRKHSVSVILFGSTARGEEKVDSDLDICIVFKNAAAKIELEKVITDLSFSLKKKYGISLAPFYISERDFVKKANAKKSPVTNIIKEGRLLFGKTIIQMIHGEKNNKKTSR